MRLRSVVLVAVGAILLGACQSDSVFVDLDLGEEEFGFKAQVEPANPSRSDCSATAPTPTPSG